MDQPTTVTLKGKQITLSAPDSYMVCVEISLAAVQNQHRAAMAALGVCWQGRPLPVEYEANPMVYGAKVMDHLIGQGVPLRDVLAAGGVALTLVSGLFITPTEEQEAADFSEAQPEG